MSANPEHKKTTSTAAIRVLMTGAGAPGAAGIIRCLRSGQAVHITVADANPEAVGRFMADDFVQVPMGDDPEFIPVLLSVCREKNIHVLMPLVTRELLPLATHLADFEMAGTRVLVSGAPSLEIANNKSRLYEFLEWRSIPVPAYRVVETADQFKTAVEALGYPARPVCFKPAVSNGSRGFRILSTQVNEAEILFKEKPSSVYMQYADAVRILSATAFPELLVSEYLPGPEYSVDCLCYRGEAGLIIPRLRKKMVNGISTEGVFEEQEEIIAYCRRIIRELQLHGNIGIQVKQAISGEFLILEINPRVQGSISCVLGAGVNLPLLAIKQALDLTTGPDEKKVKWGTRFTRFWDELFF